MAAKELVPEVKKPSGSELAVSAPTPMDLLLIATNQGADVDKIGKLMDLQLRWEANEARKAFVVAMNAFKADPPTIRKTKPGPRLGGNSNPPAYYYAPLDQVCAEIIHGLSQHGISHRWESEQPESGGVVITCVLTHERGHSERTTLKAPPDTGPGRNGIQAIASTVTYLQRYTLLSATGLAAGNMDNDANQPKYEKLAVAIENIEKARTPDELKKFYSSAYKDASDVKDQTAQKALIDAERKRRGELANVQGVPLDWGKK